MLKHDSSEETKTYSADSYERKKSAERAKQRIKEGYYRYPGESYLRITRKLVYTYVLKDIQKNIIR
jgi:hypothetical protein